MYRHARLIAAACVTALFSLSLTACSGATASSESAPEQETTAEEGQAVSREDVEAILHSAADTTFSNVSFTVRTDTTATGSASNGQVQTQSARTITRGQLDQSGETPRVHLAYEAQTNMQLGVTTYEMFIDNERLIVSQGEQLYVDAMTDEMLESYASSATSVITTEQIDAMLDVSSGYKIQDHDGNTVVTMTIDTDALTDDQDADESALPETTEIATMVASYSISPDNRITTVRLMSNTSGTPTYRVNQTYEFSDFDETVLPEWPDLDAYVAQQSGIMTDENGRMYIVGDDGQIYYVSEIGDDGMIYYDTSTTGDTGSGETYYYYDPVDYGGTSEGESTTTGESGSQDQGRAYITAADGTIHYLDEPGSEIRDLGGATVFIDADGEWYFLNYGDDDAE